MTLLNALLPTHAALAASVAAQSPSAMCDLPYAIPKEKTQATMLESGAIVQSPIPRESSPDPLLHKYIIVIPRGEPGPAHVLLFSNQITHSTMVPAGWQPISAGFCIIADGQLHIPEIGSGSLNLNPGQEDADILRKFLSL